MKSIGILEINEKAQKTKGCIRFDKGSARFPFPEEFLPIINEVKENIQGKYFHYPLTGGEPELKEEIVKLEKENGRELGPQHISVTHGGMSGIFTFFSVISSQGDEIITNWASFEGFSTVCDYFKLKQIRVDLSNINAVKQVITKKTKALIINSPENPTGKVYTKKEVDDLTKLTYKKNVYLLSDEVMSKIVYDTAKWYGPSLENRNVVVVSSFSKTWFVPGIRLGWMATKNVELIQKCNDAIVNQSVGVNLFSQLLMTYACQKINYAGFLQKRFDILVHRKNLVKNLLNKYGIGYLQNIEGGMNYYIDLKKDSSKIALELFQKYKIALIPGELFEGRKSTFARFGFGAVKKEEIIKGINVLAQEL